MYVYVRRRCAAAAAPHRAIGFYSLDTLYVSNPMRGARPRRRLCRLVAACVTHRHITSMHMLTVLSRLGVPANLDVDIVGGLPPAGGWWFYSLLRYTCAYAHAYDR